MNAPDANDTNTSDADERAATLRAYFLNNDSHTSRPIMRVAWDYIGDQDPYIRLASAERIQKRLRSELSWAERLPDLLDTAATTIVTRLITLFAGGDAAMRDGVAIALEIEDNQVLATIVERLGAWPDADVATSARQIQERGVARFRLAETKDLDVVAILSIEEPIEEPSP